MNSFQALPVEQAQAQLPELESIAATRPNSLVLHDLGVCYFTVGQPQKALVCLQTAWKKNHNYVIALSLGMVLKELGRHEESLEMTEFAFSLAPEDDYVRLAYGEGLLKAGFWKQAWPIYDNARPTQLGAALHLRLPKGVREWDGGPLDANQKLLVINEGGTGDRFCYPRWLPELTKRGINWIFYPYDELFSFYERIFPRERLVKDGEQIVPDPTHWVTPFALPAKLNVAPHDIPPPLPFTATPDMIEKYKVERPDNLPLVGICYRAGEQHQGGLKIRSLTEGQAMRIVCMTGDKIHWVSLQFGSAMPNPVSNVPAFAEGRVTWEDTAGMIANLDAVVTVDTSIMHLAASMEKPLLVPLSGNSCWKFLKTGTKCVWYPTVQLYRNVGRGYENAVDQIIPVIRNGAIRLVSDNAMQNNEA